MNHYAYWPLGALWVGALFALLTDPDGTAALRRILHQMLSNARWLYRKVT